ncbi:hypothetical protein CW735_00420 [Alteromonas sp. MB-3u-76]|jgi:RND family efflux transporter MFP subunit|nr:hypothetical protein CW735_00420 [Alteromonas sp. MB-3u-76]
MYECKLTPSNILSRLLSISLSLIALSACTSEKEIEKPSPRLVEIMSVSLTSSDSAERYVGVTRAANRSDLSFEIFGKIKEIHVEVGDTFKKGDVLATLQPIDAELSLENLTAQLNSAKAILTEAQLDYSRKSALDGSGAVSQAQIDLAQARYLSQKNIVESLQSNVSQAREVIKDTNIIAPFDGQVAHRFAEPSQNTAANQAILSVTGIQAGVEVVTNVPSHVRNAFIKNKDTSTNVLIRQTLLPATIIEIGASADSSGLFPITLVVDNTDLAAGETVYVRAPTSAAQRLIVPTSAIIPDTENTAFVFTFSADSKTVIKTKVQVDAPLHDGIPVISGLNTNELIVAKGAVLLKDGEVVQPANTSINRFNQ